MARTAAEVLKMVKDNEVKFVDFRFADTRGKEQHVTVPVSHFDLDKFESGHAFDGSSIAGWKGIEASDMILMPDPNTAQHRPVHGRDHAVHAVRRDRAVRRQGLRPRPALDRQARRSLPEVDRHRRHRLLRPGAGILHLRQRALEDRHVGLLRQDRFGRSRRGRPTRKSKAATAATVRPSRAATSRCLRSTASRTCVRKCA